MWYVVRGTWCVMCGTWYVVWYVVCGVWYVVPTLVCGVWYVVRTSKKMETPAALTALTFAPCSNKYTDGASFSSVEKLFANASESAMSGAGGVRRAWSESGCGVSARGVRAECALSERWLLAGTRDWHQCDRYTLYGSKFNMLTISSSTVVLLIVRHFAPYGTM